MITVVGGSSCSLRPSSITARRPRPAGPAPASSTPPTRHRERFIRPPTHQRCPNRLDQPTPQRRRPDRGGRARDQLISATTCLKQVDRFRPSHPRPPSRPAGGTRAARPHNRSNLRRCGTRMGIGSFTWRRLANRPSRHPDTDALGDIDHG